MEEWKVMGWDLVDYYIAIAIILLMVGFVGSRVIKEFLRKLKE